MFFIKFYDFAPHFFKKFKKIEKIGLFFKKNPLFEKRRFCVLKKRLSTF